MKLSTLILGGTGFLGSAVAEHLLSLGHKVTLLARGNKPNRFPDLPFIAADRSRPGALKDVVGEKKFDLVVDCAAFKEPDVEEAILAFHGRIGHYIFISTDFVYQAGHDLSFPIVESAANQTGYAYGVDKLACEKLLLHAFKVQHFPATILRPPHILGHGKVLGADFSQMRDPRTLEYIAAGQGLTLTEGGLLLIQPVHHREIAACIAHIVLHPRTFGQVFNIAGPDCVTTLGYYQIIADFLGYPLKYESISMEELARLKPEKASVFRHRIYDLSHLTGLTGYKPRYPLADALLETITWMLNP